jgi:hypothetical protein
VPEKFKLEDLNHEELLRFRVVSTVCTSQAGAHIFGIIGIVVRASSEHISSVNLRAMAKQLDGSDLMDKLNQNGARGVCTPPCALSSQAIAQGNKHRVIFMPITEACGVVAGAHLLITTTLPTKSTAQPTAKKAMWVSAKFLHDMARVSTGHCATVYATSMEHHMRPFCPPWSSGAGGAKPMRF